VVRGRIGHEVIGCLGFVRAPEAMIL
jgi:hypothetical protein